MQEVSGFNPYLRYEGGELTLEGVPLGELAERFGTPLFVYSASFIRERFSQYREAFPDALVCYALKANFNPSIVRLLSQEGAGADIVSGGELYLALGAGVPPERIVYAGVGKTERELKNAIVADILMFNAESRQELEVLNELAGRLKKRVRVAIRVNPDVDPKTHPYIATGMQKSKFGIDIKEARKEYEYARSLPNLDVVGIHCHIGSQILDTSPYEEAVEKVVELYESLTRDGFDIRYLDIGGGLGIKYKPEDREPTPFELAEALEPYLSGVDAKLILEPGRSIVGNAGVLITQVQFVKEKGGKRFIITDAGMNDLIRPSIYNAYHHIVPVRPKGKEKVVADIVGPICETGDFLALDREIEDVGRGDYLAVLSAGAYAFAMSSHYNMRPRACEVIVDGGDVSVVRWREDYDYILAPAE
ncbi:MAG: diaminopimelate decarboxylase [Aquificae bacterium]|nr:diaminopimelate decarboxylase [Aquificota bacterium]